MIFALIPLLPTVLLIINLRMRLVKKLRLRPVAIGLMALATLPGLVLWTLVRPDPETFMELCLLVGVLSCALSIGVLMTENLMDIRRGEQKS